MTTLTIGSEIIQVAPHYGGYLLECNCRNSLHDPALWAEIAEVTSQLRRSCNLLDLHHVPAIRHMRWLYKQLGKDPNRYRPSSEALCRRLLLGKELYPIHTLVDLINLVSIRYGFSIGGFDRDKIAGALSIGVGRAGEPFEAIGRGSLNIEGLPVYRDEIGPIGTPTSDEERSKLNLETTRLLLIIHSADANPDLDEALADTIRLLETYAQATHLHSIRF